MIQLSETLIQRRPLLSIETAAYLREESQDTIRLQIDTGKLCGWDLRAKNSRTRGCARILARSLNAAVDESEIYSWVPKWNPTAAQLTRVLNVSQALVAALLIDGSLKQIGKPAKPKQSPKVCRESLLGFLRMRRIGFKPFSQNKPLPRVQRTNAPQAKSSDGLHTVLKRGATIK